MATVIRGKEKGKIIKMHQFCNDWVSDMDGNIYSITNLTFTNEEIELLLQSDTGILFQEFKLLKNKRFVKNYDNNW
jgi:hypothetical protein